MIELFQKYAGFNGSADRSEYWGVMLISIGVNLAMWMMFMITSGVIAYTLGVVGTILIGLFFATFAAASVLLIWLGVATSVRRCNDAGINPWFTAAIFIPYIGFLVAIVIGVLEPKNKNIST